jgi:tryptophanyl-tRNA synthetase
MTETKKRILTGDRPTGKLHLGHYVGTLANRIRLQHEYETFIIIADLHMLTTKNSAERDRCRLTRTPIRWCWTRSPPGLDPSACDLLPPIGDPRNGRDQHPVPEPCHGSRGWSGYRASRTWRAMPTSRCPTGCSAIRCLQAADILHLKAQPCPCRQGQCRPRGDHSGDCPPIQSPVR